MILERARHEQALLAKTMTCQGVGEHTFCVGIAVECGYRSSHSVKKGEIKGHPCEIPGNVSPALKKLKAAKGDSQEPTRTVLLSNLKVWSRVHHLDDRAGALTF